MCFIYRIEFVLVEVAAIECRKGSLGVQASSYSGGLGYDGPTSPREDRLEVGQGAVFEVLQDLAAAGGYMVCLRGAPQAAS